MKRQAVHPSETSVNFYQTARCRFPGDSTLNGHRSENLKSFYNLVNDQGK
jgi:hypothetical protein